MATTDARERKTSVDVLAQKGDDILVKHRKEKPNSYEAGSAGNRFKIFFEDAEDLDKQIKELKEKGFVVEEAYDL